MRPRQRATLNNGLGSGALERPWPRGGRAAAARLVRFLARLGGVRLVLWGVVIAAVAGAGYRMWFGLGAATHLSDAWPWGIWKIVGVVAGIPLAAGAFVIAAWVHIFGRHHGYESLARPAVLAGFIGYLTAIFSLVVDIGQPWRIWHPIVMWQIHSVLFEVCWCVILYTTVLALEFAPVACSALGWERAGRLAQQAIVPIAGAGATLCVLHQSSLGSLFLIAPGRMHPLWYTPWLPLLFFISAAAAGLATLQLQLWAADRLYGRRVAARLPEALARGLAGVLGLYTLARLADWVWRGTGPWRTPWGPEAALAWTELLLGTLLPALVLASPALRARPGWRLGAAGAAAAGVLLHRLDTGLIAMEQVAWQPYVPSAIETVVMLGMVAAGLLAYDWVARHWPLFETHGRTDVPSGKRQLSLPQGATHGVAYGGR